MRLRPLHDPAAGVTLVKFFTRYAILGPLGGGGRHHAANGAGQHGAPSLDELGTT